MTDAEKSDVDNPYRYSTKEWDGKSGLYYFGARYYSAEIGRWTQRDPAGTVDGLNLYLYVANEPANRVDPWGLYQDVHVYRSGPPWTVEDVTLGIVKCHYWVEAFGQRWGLGGKGWSSPLGPGTSYSGDYDWRVKWSTTKRTTGKMKIRDRTTGKVKKMCCSDARADDILNCMELVRDTIGPYKVWAIPPRTCWTMYHRLTDHCCLDRGQVVATRAGSAIPGSKK